MLYQTLFNTGTIQAHEFTSVKPATIKKKPIKNHIVKLDLLDNDFKKMINILNCNTESFSIRNKYSFADNNEASEYINYFCGNKNCLKCKQANTRRYIKNRIISVKYFLTISTPWGADILHNKIIKGVDHDDYLKFKKKLRLFFDYLEIPAIASLEMGSKGNKLHAHVIIQKTNLSSIKLTDLSKAFFGFVTQSEVVSGGLKNKKRLVTICLKSLAIAQNKTMVNSGIMLKLINL